jgi:hypothetical protein
VTVPALKVNQERYKFHTAVVSLRTSLLVSTRRGSGTYSHLTMQMLHKCFENSITFKVVTGFRDNMYKNTRTY